MADPSPASPPAPSRPADTASAAPVLWCVAGDFGAVSEVWMRRQLLGLDAFRRRLICSRLADPDDPPPGVALTLFRHHRPPRSPVERWARRAARLRGLPQRNLFIPPPRYFAAMLELAQAEPPAVVLAHFGRAGLTALPVTRALGVPLVVHFHGVDLSQDIRSPVYRWSLTHALPHLAAMVVVAPHHRDWLLAHGADPHKVHNIAYGAPVETFQPGTGVDQQPCRFLAVGRFVDKKRPDHTLRAFAACAAGRAGVTLTMVGDGPLLDESRRLAEAMGVADRVTFTGPLATNGVREQMQAAGAFVQHSAAAPGGDMEGWPVAIAEAMACALPVVATRHAGIPEQVADGETGLLVDEHDVDAMARAMAQLADHPERRRAMGLAGRDRMCRYFDARDQVRKLQDVLLAAAGPR